MQLPSIPSANITGSGPVIRSSTPPGVMSGSVPSTPPSPSTTPSAGDAPSVANQSPARNEPGSGTRQPAPASTSADTGSRDRGDNRVDRASPDRRGSGSAPPAEDDRRDPEGAPRNQSEGERAGGEDSVSPEKQSVVNELRARDREVRQHEQAHQTVGGQYAGGATYDYQRGPDGKLYATGGQVSIDTSKVADDPRATINKMQTVRAAALAPAEPSPQDIRVAQEATSKMLAAQAELRAERRDDGSGTDGPSESGTDRVFF